MSMTRRPSLLTLESEAQGDRKQCSKPESGGYSTSRLGCTSRTLQLQTECFVVVSQRLGSSLRFVRHVPLLRLSEPRTIWSGWSWDPFPPGNGLSGRQPWGPSGCRHATNLGQSLLDKRLVGSLTLSHDDVHHSRSVRLLRLALGVTCVEPDCEYDCL